METKFTSQDITNFIKMFVAVGGSFYVDDNSIVHQLDQGKDNIWAIPNKEKPPRHVKISVYDVNQKDPDTIVLNPFVEGLNTSDELRWFYTTKNMTIGINICRIVKRIIEECLKAKVKCEEEHSAEIAKLISPFIDLVDDKMLAEFSYIYQNITNLLNIYWDRNKHLCTFKIGVFDEKFRKSFSKRVRQKTWDALIKIFSTIFGTEDIVGTYKYHSDSQGYARIECYSQVYLMILKAIRQYLPLIEVKDNFDFDVFEEHVKMIPLYYTRAKHLVTPAISGTPATTQATPAPWINPACPSSAGVPVGSTIPSGVPVVPVVNEPGTNIQVGAPLTDVVYENPVAAAPAPKAQAPVQMHAVTPQYIPPQPQVPVQPQGWLNPVPPSYPAGYGYPGMPQPVAPWQQPMQPQLMPQAGSPGISVGHAVAGMPANPPMQYPGQIPQPGAVLGMSVPFNPSGQQMMPPGVFMTPQGPAIMTPQGPMLVQAQGVPGIPQQPMAPMGFGAPVQFYPGTNIPMPQGMCSPQMGFGGQMVPGMFVPQPQVLGTSMGMPVVASANPGDNRSDHPQFK